MSAVPHDLRTAVRALARRPLTTVVAVVVLALGLASGTAVFTSVAALDQRIPGISHAGGLVQVSSANGDFLSFPDVRDYAAENGVFAEMAAAQHAFPGSYRSGELTHHIIGQKVTGGYFALLGVEMELGRGLTPEDDRAGAPPVVVLSHRFWRQQRNADPDVLGREVHLSGNPFTVVGVVAPEFLGALSSIRADVWVPTAQWPLINQGWGQVLENRDYPYFLAYGRLRPGATLEAAQAEVDVVAARLDQAHPRAGGKRQVLARTATWVRPAVQGSMRPLARLMLASTALLLLLACANVANLLVATAAGRRREMAVRAALGASPHHVLRLLLIESSLVSLLAGTLGLFLAGPVGRRIVSHMIPADSQAYQAPPVVALDLRVFLFAVAASLLAGLVAGYLPARTAARGDLVTALRSATAEVRKPGRRWRRQLLVSTQVALATVLLVFAGLVLQTLEKASRIDPGFAADHLLTATVSIYAENDPRAGQDLYQEILDRIAEEPWASSASLTPMRPLTGSEYRSRVRIDGRDAPVTVYRTAVAPPYLETMGLELLHGRPLTVDDDAGAPSVVLINETLARTYFDGREALGRRVWLPGPLGGREERGFEIVGIVRDTPFLDLFTEPEPLLYCSFRQLGYSKRNALMVRTEGPPNAALPALRRLLRGIDPDLATIDAMTYGEVVRGALSYKRMSAEAFSVVALLGLVLACAGVFAVMSLGVRRQRREIGLRLAVGASRRDVMKLILGQALRAVGLGLGFGLLAAFLTTRFIAHLLYGVEATDVASFLTAAFVLAAAGLLATALPALRASRIDPLVSLRCE